MVMSRSRSLICFSIEQLIKRSAVPERWLRREPMKTGTAFVVCAERSFTSEDAMAPMETLDHDPWHFLCSGE